LDLEIFHLLNDDEKIYSINNAKEKFENKIINKKNIINETIIKLELIKTSTLNEKYTTELFVDSLKEIDYLLQYCLN
jgi:hypothetical protein